jgi:small subunit ribosomal protein S6
MSGLYQPKGGNMKRYETIVISDPELSEEDRDSLMTRIKEIIPQKDGVLIQEDIWGARKLAYEIKKKLRGHYVRYDYCGMGNVVDELERFFRIDDRVMKYLTVQLADTADAEKIKAELAVEQTGGTETASEASPTEPSGQVQEKSTAVDTTETETAATENKEE